MRSLLSSKPVRWFLFLFNFAVAAAAPFVIGGMHGLLASIGMSLVSLGAGISLLRSDIQQQRPGALPLQLAHPHLEVVRGPATTSANAGSQWTSGKSAVSIPVGAPHPSRAWHDAAS